jgi:hypothetical protein
MVYECLQLYAMINTQNTQNKKGNNIQMEKT